MEERHLAEADRHIAAGERLISQQQARLAELTAAGRDTAEAEKLLWNLEQAQGEFYAHRKLIVAKMEEQAHIRPDKI